MAYPTATATYRPRDPRPPPGLPAPSASYSGTGVYQQGGQQAKITPVQPKGGPFKPGRGNSVSQIMSQREGNSNAYYADGTPVPTGMPIYNSGWNVRGMERGGRIGSAAGALGSGGVPTSQRGRLEKYGMDSMGRGAWEYPSWMVSEQMRNNGGGLSQSWRYGNMGLIPPSPYRYGDNVGRQTTGRDALMREAADFEAVEEVPLTGREGLMREADQFQAVAKPASGVAAALGRGGSLFGTGIRDMRSRARYAWI